MILDLWHEERLDEAELLTVEIPADDPKAYLLAADHEITFDGRVFIVGELETVRDGQDVRIRVECPALWYRLGDPTTVGSLVLDDVTPAEGLEQILAATGWTVGTGTVTTSDTFTMEQQDATPLALIREWAKITGTKVAWDTAGRAVSLVASRGADRGMAFRYRRNLLTVRKRETPPAATVLYPYGALSLSIAGLNGGVEYLENFDWYTARGLTLEEARTRFTRSRVWADPSFVVDSDLMAAAETLLEQLAAGSASYECSVVDLSELLGVSQRVDLADVVRVIDDDLGVNVDTVVVRLRRFPLQPWRDEVELGTLQDVSRAGARSASRPQQSETWTMFRGDSVALFEIRNNGTWTTNRLPLRFRAGGLAHYHVDFHADGIGGPGTLFVSVVDALTDATIYRETGWPTVSGETTHGSFTWSADALSGPFDYRVRFRVASDGGADPVEGVDVVAGESRFYVLAIGAVQETPAPGSSSELFDYTGSVQQFTVPDNVTEITIEAAAGAGGGLSSDAIDNRGGSNGGKAGRVTATFDVTPGEVLDVYVGGAGGREGSGGSGVGGWPNGGAGLSDGSGSFSAGGGGASFVVPLGASLPDALIVAGAGGGHAQYGPSRFYGEGGYGGFWSGTAGSDISGAFALSGGQPGTGSAPGQGGTIPAGDAEDGDTDGQGHGGDAVTYGGPFPFPAGGGGGGWHGGGGGVGVRTVGGGNYGAEGGGGSGYVRPDAFDLLIEDGVHGSAEQWDGYVLISWTPAE